MSCRGIYQLKNITLLFCDWGGSSKGTRELLQSDLLKEFINNNQQISFDFFEKRGCHPYISSFYINGYRKDASLRNLSPKEIIYLFERFRDSMGRRHIPHAGQKVFGIRESIQGMWRPNMWGTYPKVEMEKERKLKEIDDKLIMTPHKKVRELGKQRHKDHVNDILREKDWLGDL